jgi:hypothetical protein
MKKEVDYSLLHAEKLLPRASHILISLSLSPHREEVICSRKKTIPRVRCEHKKVKLLKERRRMNIKQQEKAAAANCFDFWHFLSLPVALHTM